MTVKHTNKTPLIALFDGDLICYKACAVVEKEIRWDEDLHTIDCNLVDAVEVVTAYIDRVTKEINPTRSIFCFTSGNNFRKEIYPLYKATRDVKRKPLALMSLREHIKKTYEAIELPGVEADDIIGIIATTTSEKYPGEKIIISQDKDFRQIPSTIYISSTEKDKNHQLLTISLEEADRFFYMQTLMGDKSDNYPGCPKIGPVIAAKELAKVDITDKQAVWKRIVEIYQKNQLSEEFALQMARCARLLRNTDFDFRTKKPILWTP